MNRQKILSCIVFFSVVMLSPVAWGNTFFILGYGTSDFNNAGDDSAYLYGLGLEMTDILQIEITRANYGQVRKDSAIVGGTVYSYGLASSINLKRQNKARIVFRAGLDDGEDLYYGAGIVFNLASGSGISVDYQIHNWGNGVRFNTVFFSVLLYR